MNIYLVSQDENNDWDTYDAIVVIAEDEDKARKIHPDGKKGWEEAFRSWASSPDKVKVELIGRAITEVEGLSSIVLASFNAG